MKKSFLAISLIIGCSLFLAACASAPTAEITATKAAVATAQTDEVRTYAPDSLKSAEDELNKAFAEVQTQDGKFFVSRDYKQASAGLKSAKDLAEKAVSDAQANKAKAKSDAEAALAALPQSIEEPRRPWQRHPRARTQRLILKRSRTT